ncbi:MAG: S-layer homology domain-containing protein [Candidatus Abawacabacteria bacterium]|nr:S-layer homology domain-containing protein [Candidatus Abawacabacteria bacterium]
MRKIFLSTLILFLVFYSSVACAMTANPIVSAWIPSWDFIDGTNTIVNNVDLFTEISPFWYYLEDNGNVMPSSGSENKEFIDTLHNYGIRVIPSITNSFKDERASQVMADDAKRKKFVTTVMNLVKKNNYDGIDIDFEGLKLTNKDNFVILLKDLATQLHAQNKFLTVAVQAKTSDPGPWETVQAQDWKAISEAVDRFRIMAYDEHYSGSQAGPISSTPWVQSIMDFAKTQVPEEKLILGLPLYGYNWGEKEKTYAVTFKDLQYLLKKHNPSIQWDEVGKEPFIEYDKKNDETQVSDMRKVYFQNKDSISSKWNVAKKYPLSGLIFWRLGGEDESVWQYLREEKTALLKTGEFSDVTTEHWAYKYIQVLRSKGLSQGNNNQFYPEKGLTRAEGLKIALLAGNIPKTNYPIVARFKDIKKGDWFEHLVQTARARSIVSGQGDNFLPHKFLSRSEAVKIIDRSGGTKVPKEIERPHDVITRAEYAKLVAVGFRWGR